VPRGIYVWFFIPERDVGDGGYIHPLPLQVLVAGSGEKGRRRVGGTMGKLHGNTKQGGWPAYGLVDGVGCRQLKGGIYGPGPWCEGASWMPFLGVGCAR
jgi:hypothetical protein